MFQLTLPLIGDFALLFCYLLMLLKAIAAITIKPSSAKGTSKLGRSDTCIDLDEFLDHFPSVSRESAIAALEGITNQHCHRFDFRHHSV